ncbi:MAG: TRAP transporter small permease subunit [Bacillota bacterium]
MAVAEKGMRGIEASLADKPAATVTPVGQQPAGGFWNRLIRIERSIRDGILMMGMLGLTLVVLVGVLTRWARASLPWTEEVARYIFIWFMFLGAAAGFGDDSHTRLQFLEHYLGASAKRLVRVVLGASVLVFLGLQVYTGWLLVDQQWMAGERGYAVRFPLALVGLSLPASGAVAILEIADYLRRTSRTARALAGETSPILDKG